MPPNKRPLTHDTTFTWKLPHKLKVVFANAARREQISLASWLRLAGLEKLEREKAKCTGK